MKFEAEWCQPCASMHEYWSTFVEEANIEAEVVDIDKHPERAQEYGIKGIPAMLIFVEGEVVSNKVGMLSKTQLLEWVDEYRD